jgi:hypothetical protein
MRALVVSWLLAALGAGCNPLIGLEVGSHWRDECEAAASDRIFCSGFEEGNKAIWDDHDENPDDTNLLLADPGPFEHDGNHVMRMTASETEGADLVKFLPSQHDRLYVRYYLRFEPGFDLTSGRAGAALHAGDSDTYLGNQGRPSGDDYFTALVTNDETLPVARVVYTGMYMNCDSSGCWFDQFPCDPDGTCNAGHEWSGPRPAIEVDRWFCVELFVDGGTPGQADGAVEIFVDSQPIGPFEALAMRTSEAIQIGTLWLTMNAPQSAPGSVFYDNVVVSTSRVGCVAAAP